MSEREHEMEDERNGVLVEEARLREALRPERPDPDDFLRGVRERIRAGERAPARHPSPWLRSAAALLPPGLVRDEFLGATVGLSGKQGLVGFAGALLLAPALALVAVVATFMFSVRRVAGRRGSASPDDPASWEAELRSLSRLNRGPWVTVFGVAFLICWFLAPILTLSLLAVSMAGLAVLLGRLGLRGLASRRVVGAVCGQLLFLLTMFVLAFSQFHPDGYLASTLSAIFALGLFGCSLLTMRSWGPVRRSTDPRVRRALAPARWEGSPAHSRVHLALAVLLVAYLVPLAAQRPAQRSALVDFVEGFDADLSYREWESWYLIAKHLVSDGGPAPRLEAVARGLHDRLDRGGGYRRISRGAARLGLLRPEDWLANEDPAEFERIMSRSGFIHEMSALPLMAHLRVRDPQGAERARIVARLESSVLAEPTSTGVREALVAVELLEDLGAHAEVTALTEHIHARLLAWWSESSDELPFLRVRLDTHSASEALELIARVGLPEGIDPRRVRHFLGDAARDPYMLFSFFSSEDRRLVAAAGLLRLESLDLDSAPDAAEWLARLRMLLPAALLSLFCLIATFLAPSGVQAEKPPARKRDDSR